MEPYTRCAWCLRANLALSEDHVFPRVLGGTKELWVPACKDCRTIISRFEQEVGRKSHYSLYCMTHGPRGRDKRKPLSGVIQAPYVLVKHPLGGYGEAVLRAGEEIPEALPHIEMDTTAPPAIRRRGMSPQAVDHLVQVLLRILDKKPDADGFVGEVSVRTDDLGEIGSDPDFWPRVVLNLAGKPFIRARNHEEALRFIATLIPVLREPAFRDYSGWTRSEIAGTPHRLLLRYEGLAVQRVIAKIAYGLSYLQLGEAAPDQEMYSGVRKFVLGNPPNGNKSPVQQVCAPSTISQWPDHHVAFVGQWRERTVGLVSLYGDCHIVDLGPLTGTPHDHRTTVAMCRRDGTRARLVDGAVACDIVRILTQEAGRAQERQQ